MAPESLGSNFWQLGPDEKVSGEGGTIEGPKIVRVHEFDDKGKALLMVQAGDEKVTVNGSDFKAVVQKK